MKKQFMSTAIIALISIVMVSGLAYAQEEAPEEAVLTFEEQLAIVGVGVLAGLITAYQGFSKSGEDFVLKLFLDRVITAVIASLAIAVSTVVLEEPVTLFTLVMVFLASIGTASLFLTGRQKTKSTSKPRTE